MRPIEDRGVASPPRRVASVRSTVVPLRGWETAPARGERSGTAARVTGGERGGCEEGGVAAPAVPRCADKVECWEAVRGGRANCTSSFSEEESNMVGSSKTEQ